MQLLGIGREGHIGFNEPGSSLASRTRLKTLTPQTAQDNAKAFQIYKAHPEYFTTDVGSSAEYVTEIGLSKLADEINSAAYLRFDTAR